MILLKDGVEYIQYSYKSENELENMVFEHYKEIFGDNTILFNKSKIKTVANVGTIPDAFVVDLKNKKWYIVEVELKDHDVYGHVNSQIMKFLDAIDNQTTKKELSDKFYKEVENEPFKEALFKTNNIKEVYKHIFDIIDTTPSIVIIIDEINDKVETGLNGLSKRINCNIETIEFRTFKRKNSKCLSEHIHLFSKLYEDGEEEDENEPTPEDKNNNETSKTPKPPIYTEDYHLNGKPDNIIGLYKELKERILDLDKNIKVNPVKNYIAYKILGKNFVDLKPRKSKLEVCIYLSKDKLNDSKKIAKDVKGWYGRKIDVNENTDLDYIISLIKQSYEYNKKRSKK
jgi:predicted transport protein